MRLFLATLLALSSSWASEFPPITDFGPTNEYGASLQRSMRLMAGSDPNHKSTVRVMIYGQSVSQQSWWLSIADWFGEEFEATLDVPDGIKIFVELVLIVTAELAAE